jgi:hypothetical protein
MAKKSLAYAAVLASCGAALGPCALAASWIPVAQTDQSLYMLDESSIERQSGYVTAWELVEYALPQESDGVSYRSQLNLRAYRCNDGSWDVLTVTRFAGSQSSGEAVLSSRFDPAAATWHPARPDTVAGVLLQRVCSIAGARAG